MAQSGSALGWGPSGRRFKSCLPDVDNNVRFRCPSQAEVAHAGLAPAEVVGDLVADRALNLGAQ